ncbi:MAG: hypothetical protein ED559_04585 [Phycisphaera sp.]|nr:MAG: hypothetical protein ED559_04585 [Phycisphaera sp.]
MCEEKPHSKLIGPSPVAARSLKMLNQTQTRRIGAVSIIAAVGLAGGCTYDHNSDWSTTDEPNPEALASAEGTDTENNTYEVTMMDQEGSIWDGLFEEGDTEPEPALGPIDIFGGIEGRSMTQGNPNAPAAYDPADLHRVSFSTYGADFDPVATDDGNYIFFASTRHRETADIYRKHVNSSVVSQITNDPGHDVMPSLSPDGQTIAFSSNRSGNWNIYVIDAEGGQARQITQDSSHELHPSFSPDGQTMVYSRLGPVSQRWELWLVDVNNPMVKHQIGFGLFPEFCPEVGTGFNGGNRIVFQRARERGSRLFSVWSIDVNGNEASNLTEIASSSDHALINPSWSRDGNRIAYASVPLAATNTNGQPRRADIWMTNIDGTGETNLTADDAVNLMPTWGEQNTIFFISNRSGTDNIWSLGANKAVIAAGEPYVGLPGNVRTATKRNQNESQNKGNTNFADFPVPADID